MKVKLKEILTSRWIITIYMIVMLTIAAYFFYIQKAKLVEILATAKIHIILFSFVFCLINTFVYPYTHFLTFRGLRADITYWKTYRIIYLSRLGTYVPGRFWFAANYYIFSRRANLDGERIGKSYIVNNAILFLTGTICAFPVISILPASTQKLLIVLPIVILVLIHPKVLNIAIRTLYSLGKTHDNNQDYLAGLNYDSYIKIFLLYFVIWFIAAGTMYIVLLAFQPVSLTSLPICLSAAASSLLIGLLAVFAPAGLGVREGIGVIVLSQITSIETAVLVMVVMRINQVITDLMCGLISTISFYREDKGRTPATIFGD